MDLVPISPADFAGSSFKCKPDIVSVAMSQTAPERTTIEPANTSNRGTAVTAATLVRTGRDVRLGVETEDGRTFVYQGVDIDSLERHVVRSENGETESFTKSNELTNVRSTFESVVDSRSNEPSEPEIDVATDPRDMETRYMDMDVDELPHNRSTSVDSMDSGLAGGDWDGSVGTDGLDPHANAAYTPAAETARRRRQAGRHAHRALADDRLATAFDQLDSLESSLEAERAVAQAFQHLAELEAMNSNSTTDDDEKRIMTDGGRITDETATTYDDVDRPGYTERNRVNSAEVAEGDVIDVVLPDFVRDETGTDVEILANARVTSVSTSFSAESAREFSFRCDGWRGTVYCDRSSWKLSIGTNPATDDYVPDCGTQGLYWYDFQADVVDHEPDEIARNDRVTVRVDSIKFDVVVRTAADGELFVVDAGDVRYDRDNQRTGVLRFDDERRAWILENATDITGRDDYNDRPAFVDSVRTATDPFRFDETDENDDSRLVTDGGTDTVETTDVTADDDSDDDSHPETSRNTPADHGTRATDHGLVSTADHRRQSDHWETGTDENDDSRLVTDGGTATMETTDSPADDDSDDDSTPEPAENLVATLENARTIETASHHPDMAPETVAVWTTDDSLLYTHIIEDIRAAGWKINLVCPGDSIGNVKVHLTPDVDE